ncbi:glycosyltransferase [Myxococcota bacterium]|nr:glycosyltransferase [Myxococcota bacterium]
MHTQNPSSHLQVAVLIATCNRPTFLANRALPSVVKQTLCPDYVIVVDDSEHRFRAQNRQIVAYFSDQNCKVVYLANYRTKGASGTWNTGIDWLSRHTDPNATFVAILDDDDSWEPEHLELCIGAAEKNGSDMVVTGLFRHEKNGTPPREQSIPTQIFADEFLVRSPHIQGSNLVVRLQVFLEAGLFDEALASTTDRDMCLRIADLGDVRFEGVQRHTVHHHAEPSDRPRLCTPDSPARHKGMDTFYRKYQGRMSGEAEKEFLKRAQTLFNCNPTLIDHLPPSTTPTEAPMALETISIVVGIITDPDKSERLRGLLSDLAELRKDPLLSTLDVVILENGESTIHQLQEVVIELQQTKGLRCYLVPASKQADDAKNGFFGQAFERGPGRIGLDVSRPMLQQYILSIVQNRPESVVWLLDDDKRLDPLVSIDGRGPHRQVFPLVQNISALKQAGASIVLGADTDSPPLPFSSAIRTQMVDLYHNLYWLSKLDPTSPLPDRSIENAAARAKWRDYYYDLSRLETDHLEAPFWIVPDRDGETVREAVTRICSRLDRILAGEQVFRPLSIDSLEIDTTIRPSILRGGNTLIFDHKVLSDGPDIFPNIGFPVRRADMIRSLIDVHAKGRKIVQAQIPVRHDRADVQTGSLDLERLESDVKGYALYSSLEDSLLSRKERSNYKSDDLNFTDRDLSTLVNRFHKYIDERYASYSLSFYRVIGLIKAIRTFLHNSIEILKWGAAPIYQIRHFLNKLEDEFQPDALYALRRNLQNVQVEQIREFYRTLTVGDKISQKDCNSSFMHEQRIENARVQVVRLTGIHELRLLGHGAEGVVFTAENKVFKYFDARVTNLKSLVGRWKNTKVLYPLKEWIEDGIHAIIVYEYEEGTPYQGGHGASLVKLLRECREAGIACRNIHPANLLVTENGVRLIDYGSDIRPLSDAEFEQMARRVWLTWRWHHLDNLKDLMRKALTADNLPELDGYQRLLDAVNDTRPDSKRNDIFEEIILSHEATKILDYGCGKGKLAARLEDHGIDVVSYDPDQTLHGRLASGVPSSMRYGGVELRNAMIKENLRFDIVVCSIVLCTIEDGYEYQEVIQDLRRFVADDGIVILAVCNPYYTFGGNTPFQDKELPEGFAYSDTFAWHSIVSSTGNKVVDFHRPLFRLKGDLLRAGFSVQQVQESTTVDFERFEPSSDFLFLTLHPLPQQNFTTSLMIKTCTMEHESIQAQVRHIVSQLETPNCFHERVLVVDSKQCCFLRGYTDTNAAAHREAVENLVASGLVDRVVEGPTDPSEIHDLYQRWFGIEANDTHAVNGAQVASTLAGFEACKGDYILQVDSDVIIARTDMQHDYLAEMANCPDMLTTAFNICSSAPKAYTDVNNGTPWRVEVRAALLHRQRLFQARPLPNETDRGKPHLAWHRSLDKHLLSSKFKSYRGGDNSTFFIHPQNEWKKDPAVLSAIRDRVENGFVPEVQIGHVDLAGSLNDWLGPKRDEPFIFLIMGTNVAPGRFRRCLDSLLQQTRKDWGAIIMDDGSTPEVGEYQHLLCSHHPDKITFLRTGIRRGKLANITWALRHLCTNPSSVIITLDADDALLGRNVIETVAEQYEQGADVTIGSMLRTDKDKEYTVDFTDPRGNGKGNIWLHLRTFRKSLFDNVPNSYLCVDGEYPRVANDWALMTSIIELASNPVFIDDKLYLHEPSGAGKTNDKPEREANIQKIMNKRPLKRVEP